jgi:hypothetical protein
LALREEEKQQAIAPMAQQKRSGPGCGTIFVLLVLLGLTIEYWYVSELPPCPLEDKGSRSISSALPDRPEDSTTRFRYSGDVSVLFVHYWFTGTPRVAALAPRAWTTAPLAVRWLRIAGKANRADRSASVGFGKA